MVWWKNILNLGQRDLVQLKTQIYQHTRGRLFVVGDLHGCYDQLMQKLADVQFNFEQDLLIAVGDLVDRGPESLKCLNLIDQPWFKAILGNHEEMCILSKVDRKMANLHADHGGEWFYHLAPIQREQVRKQCLTLPVILEVEFQNQRYGFVHADIDHNDWNEFKQSVQSQHELALWGRGRIRNKRPALYGKIQGIDQVFLGHTVIDFVTKRDNCYYLDTGCVFGRKLTLVEISPSISIEQQIKVVD